MTLSEAFAAARVDASKFGKSEVVVQFKGLGDVEFQHFGAGYFLCETVQSLREIGAVIAVVEPDGRERFNRSITAPVDVRPAPALSPEELAEVRG